jgi:hypothetical protein
VEPEYRFSYAVSSTASPSEIDKELIDRSFTGRRADLYVCLTAAETTWLMMTVAEWAKKVQLHPMPTA